MFKPKKYARQHPENSFSQQLKSKRSQEHIEVIISFVIFVGFLIAIFIFIYPLSQSNVSYVALDDVQERLFANLSFSYQKIPLILKTPAATCFIVDNPVNSATGLIVLDSGLNVKKSDFTDPSINIERTSGEKYYMIYFSDLFNQVTGASGCNPLSAGDYSFGVLTTEKSVFYENIQILNKTYLENYNGLVKSLGLKNDFEFLVLNASRDVLFNESLAVHKLKATTILSREIPLRAIDQNAKPIDIIFNLRVW